MGLGDKGNSVGSAGASNYSGDGKGGQVNMDHVGGKTGNSLVKVNGQWQIQNKATGQRIGNDGKAYAAQVATPVVRQPTITPVAALPVTTAVPTPPVAPEVYLDPQIAGRLQSALATKAASVASTTAAKSEREDALAGASTTSNSYSNSMPGNSNKGLNYGVGTQDNVQTSLNSRNPTLGNADKSVQYGEGTQSSAVPAGQKVTDVFGPKVDLDPQVAGRLQEALGISASPARTGITSMFDEAQRRAAENRYAADMGRYGTLAPGPGEKVTDVFTRDVALDPSLRGRVEQATRAKSPTVPAGQKVTDVFGPDYAQDPSIAGRNQTALSDRTYGMADIKINEDGSLSINKDESRLPGYGESFDKRTGTDLTAAVTGEGTPKAYGDDPYSTTNMVENPQTTMPNAYPNIASSVKAPKQITDRVPAEIQRSPNYGDALQNYLTDQGTIQSRINAERQRQAETSQSSVLDHIFGGKPTAPATISPTGYTDPVKPNAPVKTQDLGILSSIGQMLQENVGAGMDVFTDANEQINAIPGGAKTVTMLSKLFQGFGGGMSPGKFGPGGGDRRGGTTPQRPGGQNAIPPEALSALGQALGIDVSGMPPQQLMMLMQLFLGETPAQAVAA